MRIIFVYLVFFSFKFHYCRIQDKNNDIAIKKITVRMMKIVIVKEV